MESTVCRGASVRAGTVCHHDTWQAVVLIVRDPARVGAMLVGRSSLVVPWLCLGVLVYIGTYLSLSVATRYELSTLIAGIPLEMHDVYAQRVTQLILGGKIFTCLLPPIWTAWFGFLAVKGIDTPRTDSVTYLQVLSLVLYSEIIFGLGFVITNVLVVLTGDVFASLSLGVLVLWLGYEPNSTLFFLGSYVAVFTVWRYIALAYGMQGLCQCTRRDSLRISFVVVWLPPLSLAILRELVST